MNERIKELAEEVWGDTSGKPWSASAIAHLEHFAELVRQDEREACAEIARFARMHAIADAIMKRGRNMSTKPENIDTSAERVHETDKSVHEDDDIQEYKRPWVGLTDDEVHKIIDDCTSDEAELEELIGFSIAILVVEAKLKEKNT